MDLAYRYGLKCGRIANSNGVGISPEVFSKAGQGDSFSLGYIAGWEETEDEQSKAATPQRHGQVRTSATAQ